MSGTFGTGGDEPYRGLLGAEAAGPLVLRRIDGDGPEISIDAARWLGLATDADLSALDHARAPLLDIGCGPGRMVRAAADRSVAALGIDVSDDAVAMTSADGTPALRRSVFERLPLEGGWGTILLMDGNVGIGGDPRLLLARCRELLAEGGSLVVEAESQPDLLETAVFIAVDDDGRESGPFPWSRVGRIALRELVLEVGLQLDDEWETSGRYFLRARRADSLGTTSATAIATTARVQITASESR
ncbi:bifunctional 2-polyprenyl-6-hydroxyphenol methylase/3-demethylubiquinol 3-O-methyltransferase UbiG [Schumannella sp. 10F1B-5-1]|uniref:class I SAM-dependent methyltransferase n=1 Tax=Schumannella sp. 10F1B-5-1 TaxID=2590780 RepID=UPI0011304881|nr:class I SAM-dependent methyltransferase [Schumannella sp. 10F1B-5-1]TPW72822.1 class I SAM-dependent methyltransferase [Schumannella sp. 10F1B-5-1]